MGFSCGKSRRRWEHVRFSRSACYLSSDEEIGLLTLRSLLTRHLRRVINSITDSPIVQSAHRRMKKLHRKLREMRVDTARYYTPLHGNHRTAVYQINCCTNRSNCIRKGNRKELLVISTDLTKSTSSGYENPIMKHSPVIGRSSYARMV